MLRYHRLIFLDLDLGCCGCPSPHRVTHPASARTRICILVSSMSTLMSSVFSSPFLSSTTPTLSFPSPVSSSSISHFPSCHRFPILIHQHNLSILILRYYIHHLIFNFFIKTSRHKFF